MPQHKFHRQILRFPGLVTVGSRASHRVLLVSLGTLGGKLLPAGPLQPCAEAPSGRGHQTFWPKLTWSQDITPASMPALQYRHEAPPWHGAMCRGPYLVGFIRSVGSIRALPVLPAQFMPTNECCRLLRVKTLTFICVYFLCFTPFLQHFFYIWSC